MYAPLIISLAITIIMSVILVLAISCQIELVKEIVRCRSIMDVIIAVMFLLSFVIGEVLICYPYFLLVY